MEHQNQIKTTVCLSFIEREQLLNNYNFMNVILRKKWFSTLFLLYLFLSTGNILYGHGVVINNMSLTGQNTASDYTKVEFDISWNGSWRNSSGINNWDACWVFVKYRKKNQTTWNHATLNYVDGTNDGHTAPSGSTINTSSDGKGIMIYRSTANNANESVNFTDVQLRWNYGTDGLADNDSIEVCVFAIEMVYVPQGSFYAGDGTSSSIQGQFENGTSGTSLQITSEGSLTLGGGTSGSLGNNNATGMINADDFNDGTSITLPAAFPKGYNAFYCMKYEITQEQYVEFLNRLTYTQQAARTSNAPNSAAGTGALLDPNNYRNGIDIMTPGVSSSTPAVYACNLDGDGTYNEANDGQNIACNYINWADVAAYLDWAALRPMTELEYEKACRGNQTAVANEYAWGSTSITRATNISNSGANNETTTTSGANCNYGNHGNVQGPMRVGNFGQGVDTREGTGASYYGIFNMSDNVWERAVTVGNTNGRDFTGSHGNGALDASGNCDVTNWPANSSASGSCMRGGDWYDGTTHKRVSSRLRGAYADSNRTWGYGGRGIRVL